MKRSLIIIAIIVSILSVITISCDSDEPNIKDTTDELKGSYELNMDGGLVIEGSSADIGIIHETEDEYQTFVTVGKGNEITIIISGFSRSTGETATIDGSEITVTITGNKLLTNEEGLEYYEAESGTIKRDSKSKISFEGTFSDLLNENSYELSGSVESDAFKLIK